MSCKLGIIVTAIDNTRYNPIQVLTAEKLRLENEVFTINAVFSRVKLKSIKFIGFKPINFENKNIKIAPTINGAIDIKIGPKTGIAECPCRTSPPSFLKTEIPVTFAPVIKQAKACESS